MAKDLFQTLSERLAELSHFNSALALLQWDQEVHMPPKGAERRAKTIGYLTSLAHERAIDLDKDKTLSKLIRGLESKKFDDRKSAIIRETARNYERLAKLPKKFVGELAETASYAGHAWILARKKSDFKIFLPHLEKIVQLKRKEAEYIGYASSPYDALIDAFEPGMTSDEIGKVLNDLKEFLVPFVAEISKKTGKNGKVPLKGEFPIDKQIAFNKFIAQKMGYDLEAGLIEKSTHPFTSTFHPEDVRITTRYKEDDATYALASTIHEVGHALYEQGLRAEYFGTPLGEAISYGIHESQSKFWENIIGRSLPFWQYFYPKLQKEFPRPFKKIALRDFYRMLSYVKPSFIRTDADEVTYNLHIIVRFEIEKGMIEGSIDIKKLPEIWNQKMSEYLGVQIKKDSDGVLQDVHWSMGSIGYFPSYALGNLYSAQIYSRMRKDILNFEREVRLGKLLHIREWLRNNIHVHGKLFTADELMRRLTGEPLNSRYYIEYLTEKYSSEEL